MLRLPGSLLLGIPVGCLGYTAFQALLHPLLGALILHHPLFVLPPLIGGGAAGALAWGAFEFAGIDLLRNATALHAWIIGAACCIQLLTERRGNSSA